MTPDDRLALTPEALEYDLTGARLAEAKAAAFFARGEALPSMARGGQPRRPGVGRLLMESCDDVTWKRYRTLLHHEGLAASDDDHGILIAPACAILEGELRRLLAIPAAPIAGELFAALAPHPGSVPLSVLDDWRRGRPPMLYTLVLLLEAVRCGLEQGRPAVRRFVSERFLPEFAALAGGLHLSGCLDRIRREFRNPAGHGEKAFGPDDYERFVRLVVAVGRFDDWDRDGPDVPIAEDSGVLHHHLSNALLTTAGG
jgi:hypothetical protein